MSPELATAISSWHEFFVVGGHAGAVLLGLVFVGMEIHLDKIHENRQMYLLATGSALGFLEVLLFSLVMLAPPLWPWVPAWALIGLSLLTFLGSSAPLFAWRRSGAKSTVSLLLVVYILPYAASFVALIGSALLLTGSVGALYLIALALFIMVATGAFNAWVFLIRGRDISDGLGR
jgi:hypothetical protein